MRIVRSTKVRTATLAAALMCAASQAHAAQAAACNLSAYKAADGLMAEADANGLKITWAGDAGQSGRLQIAVQNGAPVIQELALRQGDGAWTPVLTNVVPDFAVVTGVRRISSQQLAPMRDLKIPINKENVDKYRWEPFWDAPLDLTTPPKTGQFSTSWTPIEGVPEAGQAGLPRDPSEIQRASAMWRLSGCSVRTDGARLVIDYPGVELGVFNGLLRFTVFRGTNMIRQEVIGKTTKEWVAYKYDAGLKGLPIADTTHVVWRDTSGAWQNNRLRGGLNKTAVPLRAANRLAAAETAGGAITAFPPPHRFFFAREVSTNMGYNYFRKDSAGSYSFGIRQNEHEDLSFPVYQRNWALYSARPGTEQQMTVFLYPSLAKGVDAIGKSMAFTNNDAYKPIPGFQVMNHHYHSDLGATLVKEGNADVIPQDIVAFKAMGLNIVSPIDSVQMSLFSESGGDAPNAQAPDVVKRRQQANAERMEITKMAIAGAKILSDDTFLVLPSQEVFRSPLGGHTDLIFSKGVYWDERLPGQPFEEMHPEYGKIYHIATADDFMAMARKENIIISMPHPRSKGSTGFPDAVKDTAAFNDPQYLGFGARWGMGLDGSERRLCEYRCWPLLDDMANWLADKNTPLKRMISISEVQEQLPGDDIYGISPATYVRLAKLPPPEDVTPLIEALKSGYTFWTSGEVLVPNFEVQGKGRQAKVVADVSWTFPLDFVEVVWGDGKATGREIVPATNFAPFGSHRFEIPFNATGKKWVRFAAWDSASNGAVLQPVRLQK